MKYEINNFCNASPLTIYAHPHPSKHIGNNVLITQFGGSMAMQHTMTPTQARQMAEALIACATEAELMPKVEEVTV